MPTDSACRTIAPIRALILFSSALLLLATLSPAESRAAGAFDLFTDVGSDTWMRDVAEHPEEAFTRFRDGISTAPPLAAANALSYLVAASNPHWLEIIDIGMNAADGRLQWSAEYTLEAIAFRKFPLKNAPYDYTHRYIGLLNDGGKAYSAWRKWAAGKTLKQEMTERESEVIRTIASTPDAAVRDAALGALVNTDMRSGLPLARLRRKVAEENRILDVLEACSRKGPPSVMLMYAYDSFGADEARLGRAVLPYTMDGVDPGIRSQALSTLLSRRSPLAAEILTGWILNPPGNMPRYALNHPVTICRDPKLIPIFLGALEAGEEGYLAKEMVIALYYMTKWDGFKQTPNDDRFDGPIITEWEAWWKRNRNRFPDSVRAIRIPRLPRRPRTGSAPGSPLPVMVWRDVSPDRGDGYWLIRPGAIRSRYETTGKPAPPDLMVLVCDDVDADDGVSSRAELCRIATELGSMLAIVQTPRLRLLSLDGPGAYTHGLASFLQSVRQDVEKSEGQTFHRAALVGMRRSGPDVLACGLTTQTPFQEFYIADAPFRMKELPSLVAAKGRCYTLLNTGVAPLVPKWQSDVAANILRRNGARVTFDRLEETADPSGAARTGYFGALSAAVLHRWGAGQAPHLSTGDSASFR